MNVTVMTGDELNRRFSHHPPRNPDEIQLHEFIRSVCRDTAEQVADHVPDSVKTSREWALFLTHVEEAAMWANAAFARNKGDSYKF